MNAGVDDQARGAKQERLEEAGAAERVIVIGAKLAGKLFGVERPPFRICREEAELAERRDVLRFLRDADLEVMARDSKKVRKNRPVTFTSLRERPGAPSVTAWVREIVREAHTHAHTHTHEHEAGAAAS